MRSRANNTKWGDGHWHKQVVMLCILRKSDTACLLMERSFQGDLQSYTLLS